MHRALLPLVVLVLSGCMTPRAADRVLGLVLLEGTEQPIAGATLILTPIAPLPQARRADPEDDPHALVAEVSSGAEGAFSIHVLATSDGEPARLLRGWEYELRCEAPGFFTGVERVDFDGGEEAVVVSIDVIDDELVQGEGGLFVGEAPPDRLKGLEGSLIREILRRLGREPPSGRPVR